MNNYSLNVAIIFFNRPDTLQKVFNQIRIAKPNKLFLIQDGPRIDNELDNLKILKCRQVFDNIDWECEVHKNYSDDNLGCGLRPYTGINWVFSIVNEAIFLEDDCVPNQEFFMFCKEMLIFYRNDLRIGLITGTNHFNSYNFNDYSYGFVKSGSIWGWATWKDRWFKNDINMLNFNDSYGRNLIFNGFKHKKIAKYRMNTWMNAKEKLITGKFSFWDYQWGYTRQYNSWLSIVPKNNMISNIGIGYDSTHSGKSINNIPKKIANLFFKSVDKSIYPIKHPPSVLCDNNYDNMYYRLIYPTLIETLFSKLKSIYKRFILIFRNPK